MAPFSRPASRPASGSSREAETSGLQGSRWSNAKRAPSATWSRLKPVPRDELTAYGFPSKGETKLHDHKNQETLFEEIFKRYMAFCKNTRHDEVEVGLAKLSLKPSEPISRITLAKISSGDVPETPLPETKTVPIAQPEPSSELVLIYTAMRKLREGLVASSRADTFARNTYLFLIRAAVLARQWEAYTPAIAQVISHVHRKSPLEPSDMVELLAYRILDIACRQHDLPAALALRKTCGWPSRPTKVSGSSDVVHVVDEVLHALLHDEWLRFWCAKKHATGHIRVIMEFAEENVRIHALKCLARSYFTAEKDFVEKTAGRSWARLVDEGVGWQLQVTEGEDWSQSKETVIIRKVKSR